jgi:hypothetical protein
MLWLLETQIRIAIATNGIAVLIVCRKRVGRIATE